MHTALQTGTTTYNTPKAAKRQVEEGGNPFDKRVSINEYAVIMEKRSHTIRKYRLHGESYDTLVALIARWDNNRTASTITSLSGYTKTQVTATRVKIMRLVAKGLVEQVGTRGHVKYFAPTGLALRELSAICNVA